MLVIHQPDGHEQEHAMTWLKLMVLQNKPQICWCFSIEIQSELWCQSFWAMPTWNTKVLEWSISPVKTVEHMLCHHRLLWIVNKWGVKHASKHIKIQRFSNGFLVGFSWWFFELVPDNHAWMMFYKLHTIEEDLQIFPNMVFLPLCVLNVSFMFPCCLQPDFFPPLLHRPSLEEVLRSRLLVDIGSLGSSKMLVGWRKWNAFWGMASYS